MSLLCVGDVTLHRTIRLALVWPGGSVALSIAIDHDDGNVANHSMG